MVARIAFSEPDNTYVPTETPRLSNLQFGGGKSAQDSVSQDIYTPDPGDKTKDGEQWQGRRPHDSSQV